MSEADTIYKHIARLEASEIVPITVNIDEEVKIYKNAITAEYEKKDIIACENAKRKAYFEAVRIQPMFNAFMDKKERELGVKAKFWNEELTERIKEEFFKNYYEKYS